MTPSKVFVILSTTRRGRYSEKPGAWVMSVLKETPGVEAELVDLRDWPLPFFDEPNSPNSNKGVYENPLGAQWAGKVASADAYIIIAAEYNHGYPAVLKNALDWASTREWGNKPVAFLGYGNAAGARSIEQLRQVAIELGMIPIRNAVQLPREVLLASRAEGAGPEAFEPVKERTVGMIEQLLGTARALKAAREQK